MNISLCMLIIGTALIAYSAYAFHTIEHSRHAVQGYYQCVYELEDSGQDCLKKFHVDMGG